MRGHIWGKEGSGNNPLESGGKAFPHPWSPCWGGKGHQETQWKVVIREEFPGQSKTSQQNLRRHLSF